MNASLRDGINAAARSALGSVPLEIWQTVFPKDVIALCYHMISDDALAHVRLYPYKSVATFEAEVALARDRAVTYRQVVEHRLHGKSLPRNSLLFTFDDGFAQCFDTVAPILRKNGVDGVFFVSTDYLDDSAEFFECTISLCLSRAEQLPAAKLDDICVRLEAGGSKGSSREALRAWLMASGGARPERLKRACEELGVDVDAYRTRSPIFMSRAQVRVLAEQGFTIGAHGLRHRSLEALGARELEREIVASCEVVRELTGQERVPFAFPYSGLRVDRRIIAGILRRAPGLDLVFDSGCLRRDAPFVVNRVFLDDPPRGTAVANLQGTLRRAWSIPSAWFAAPN